MYVNIKDIKNGHTTLYECTKIVFNRINQPLDQIYLDIFNGAITCETVQRFKADTEIYVMNNEGKTIDKYRWPDIQSPEWAAVVVKGNEEVVPYNLKEYVDDQITSEYPDGPGLA